MTQLNSHSSGYYITAHSRTNGTEDPFAQRACAVLLDIVERNPTFNLREDLESESLETVDDLAEDPLILEHAPDVLPRIASAILGSGRLVRLDVPADAPCADSCPIVVRAPNELHKAMGLIREHHATQQLYPFSMWGVPVAHATPANRTIDAFRTLRMDDSLFQDIIALGGLRVAVFASSITLSLSCAALSDGLAWARAALEDAPLEVKWRD